MVRALPEAGYEPITGYVLKEKLGAGGYGEVWSAEVPGGLTKAIKFVFGGIDDDRGATELKSLNRIRKLNHPFIISLERLEIIDKQLIIVTELAQGSLYDRYSEYRHKGFVGIPRDRLLRYMADAADGLDYLCQEHDLQHLDVKPGNLLLVADRVKVADFGLVKSLQSASQSMMSGLTPTYAAPEMFDGRPGRYSDQYSLAIVYQELLTGTLPFRGRTAAQLANEHVNRVPNLDAVPLIERPVLTKALSKKPHLRYADCREFIRALQDCRDEAKIVSQSEQDLEKRGNAPGRTPVRASAQRVQRSGAPQNAPLNRETFEHEFENELRPVQLQHAMPPIAPDSKLNQTRILFVGLGGTGGLALQQLNHQLKHSTPTLMEGNSIRSICIDTDWESLQRLTDPGQADSLPPRDTLLLRLNSSQYFRKATSPDLQRISRRWIFNIPRALKTEGIRPLGMLAYLDQARMCYDALHDAITELIEEDVADRTLKVYLIASSHGGTGGAIVSEIGFLLRQIARNLDVRMEIQAMLTCAETHSSARGDLAAASAVACLEEIRQHVDSGGLHEPLKCIPNATAIDQAPFDYVTLVHGGTVGEDRDWKHAICQIVDYVWLLDRSDLGRRISRARELDRRRFENGAEYSGDLWLGTVGVAKLNLASFADSAASANRCSLLGIQAWITVLKQQVDDLSRISSTQPHAIEATPQETESAWGQELFRTLHWSVPAWVRRIMGTVAPVGSKSPDPSKLSSPHQQASTPYMGPLRPEELADIDAIAEKLSFDSSICGQRVCELLEQTRIHFVAWLERHALQNIYGWKHLGGILSEISIRLRTNAGVAFEIAKQLARTHDNALETAYDGDQSPPKQLEFQLDALALEMRFHALAGRLFVRLSEDLQGHAQLWLQHARQLINELTHLAIPLLNELGIQDENFISKKPDFLRIAKDSFSCTAMNFLKDHIHSRWNATWELDLKSSRTTRFDCEDIQRLHACVKTAIETLGTVAPPGGPVASKDSDRNTDLNLQFFNDPQGWSTLFGGGHDGSENDHQVNEGFAITHAKGTINADLREEFDRTVPPLVKFGGISRNALLISDELSTLLNDQHWQQIHERCATIIGDPIPSNCLIYSIGERIDMDTIIERTWPRTRSLQELKQRLHCHSV